MWGVKTLQFIPKGTFICEYIGELYDDLETPEDDYIFTVMDASGEDAVFPLTNEGKP